MNKKRSNFLIFLILSVSFSITILQNKSPEDIYQKNSQRVLVPFIQNGHALIQFEEHDPIMIVGNSDFINQASSENWKGEGTKSNPYVISGLNITESSGNLVNITDTDLYFEIKNCILMKGTFNGFIIENVTNAWIISNIICNNTQNGIYLDNSEEIVIANNTICNNTQNGIYLDDSEEIIIANNTICNNNNNGIAVLGYFSDNNTIFNNSIRNNDNGILVHSNLNKIANNTLIMNREAGLMLSSSDSNLITHNNISYNEDGLHIRESDLNTISNNLISNNSNSGIYQCFSSMNNTILSNTIKENWGQGICLGGSHFNTIINNTVNTNGQDGIRLSSSDNNTVAYNFANFNSWVGTVIGAAGICLSSNSVNNTVTNNTINNNNYAGIEADHSEYNVITYNCINYNLYGIRIHYDPTQFNIITDNIVHNNSRYGVYLRGEYNTMKNNIISNTSENGVDLSGEYNTVSHNLIINSGKYGIAVSGENNEISHNEMNKNYNGVSLGGRFNNLINNIINSNIEDGINCRRDQNFIGFNVINNNGENGMSFYDDAIANEIYSNSICNNNYDGISLESGSNDNILNFNIINNNNIGIKLNHARSNSIEFNNISNNNDYGLYLLYSYNNNITNNNFNNNYYLTSNSQAYDSGDMGLNLVERNFWADWISPDNNNDGIVDDPYLVDGNRNTQDSFPSCTPIHQLSPPTILYPCNERIEGSVIIQWAPSTDLLGHPVTYSVFYSLDSGTNWILLSSNLVEANYTWDTTTVCDGENYLIKVNATCANGFSVVDISEDFLFVENDIPCTSSLTFTTLPTSAANLITTEATETSKKNTKSLENQEITTFIGIFSMLLPILIVMSFLRRKKKRSF